MRRQKEDILDFLGKAICIVFFFLMMSSFTNTPAQSTSGFAAIQLTQELQLNPAKAIIVDAGQVPEFHYKWISFLDITNFKPFSSCSRLLFENTKIAKQFIQLHDEHQTNCHKAICLFYVYFFSSGSDDVPVLS